MDSLSNMATSALAQVVQVISTVESLRNTGLSIASILIECGGIRVALLQIQNLMSKDNGPAANVIFSRAVMEKYPAALRACSLTFITLNEQLSKLGANGTKSKPTIDFSKKLRSLWSPSKEVQIETVCHSIRGQTIAIGLLLHALQLELTSRAFGLAKGERATYSGANVSRSKAATIGDSQLHWRATDSDDSSIASTLGDEKSHSKTSDIDSAPAYLQVMTAMEQRKDQLTFFQTTTDLESTSIEVEARSMESLIQKLCTLKFLKGLHGKSPNTSPQTRVDLESLIENAQLLFERSPALLQISVRAKIVNSSNTQYGIKKGYVRQILSTSQQIKEAISFLAPYFDHWTKEGSTQFRSRFLQLIILLLFLVSDVHLDEISSLLESTYKLKADRRHLELLFLRVIPLISSTPKEFLQGIVFVLEGNQVTDLMDLDGNPGQGRCWDACILQILDKGYLLPGSTPDLGREQFSWIMKWPEVGFTSTEIFKNLQYAGDGPSTMSYIPPLEFEPRNTSSRMGVIMTNGKEYSICPTDFGRISTMSPGNYAMREAGVSHYELSIERRIINTNTYKAILKINKVIRGLNKTCRYGANNLPPECKWSGNIQQTRAAINEKVLALNFKINGKDSYRIDVAQAMSQDIREAAGAAEQILLRIADAKIPSVESLAIQRTLEKAKAELLLAREARQKILIADEFKLNSNPIQEVLKTGNASTAPSPGLTEYWSDYNAWFEGVNTRLHIEALRSTVSDVSWLSDHKARISLKGHKTKYVVEALAPVEGDACTHPVFEDCTRYQALHEGYYAILAGQYLIVADRLDKGDRGRGEFRMRNYLRIVDTIKPDCCSRHERSGGLKGSKVISVFR